MVASLDTLNNYIELVSLSHLSLLPDDSCKLVARISLYNTDGTKIAENLFPTGQTGNKNHLNFEFNDLLDLTPGAEIKFYLKMETNNQTFTGIMLGKKYIAIT